ncbi:patatin-like phospholipase family protein [Dyella jiangningensis]|uniref:patatin-like phospholipase family protein n=1 Tax=Dyella jiangningensis TaxID=1379159 RepID=UPI00240F9420|nr:patatin-like phospholipase family protein [Dyella jiangningensis]MDG2539795.1 patatin-like phospholipase family protein [Dyella jiangningensis]
MDVAKHMPAPDDFAKAIKRDYRTVALVLQGGGALGAYQAGVFEALDSAGIHPNWIAGISIGALNAAIIAGNPPKHRVERLREFWQTICRPPLLPTWPTPPLDPGAWELPWLNGLSGWSALRTLMEGQPGFFVPRPFPLLPWRASPTTASWYDTSPLRDTLERLVDFDRINHKTAMRVSVGAVNIRTGNFAYFDNTEGELRVEHFMASGSLPPGFPATEIDGEFYWDGGMVSNTPLYKVLSDASCRDALIFQVDLWSARGEVPRDLAEVTARAKDIQYSSRTRLITEFMGMRQKQQRLLQELMALVPEDQRHDPAYRRAEVYAGGSLVNLFHLIYRNKPYEGHYKDYEFSFGSMQQHWHSGMDDMQCTLREPQWFARPDAEHPFVTHDVHCED